MFGFKQTNEKKYIAYLIELRLEGSDKGALFDAVIADISETYFDSDHKSLTEGQKLFLQRAISLCLLNIQLHK